MAKPRVSRIVSLTALLFTAVTGCASWPFPDSWKSKEETTPEVPRRLLQADFSKQESAQMCLAAARELDAGGHVREAIIQYERARQQEPSLPGLSWRLGVLYARMGEPARADAEFRAACAATPDNADLLNDYGYFLLQAGTFDQAEPCLRRALQINADHPRARCNLGILLARQGRLQESFDVFSAMVGPASAHHNIGVLLAQQGRTAEAQQAFQQALVLSPGLQQAQGMLAYLDRHERRQVSGSGPASWR